MSRDRHHAAKDERGDTEHAAVVEDLQVVVVGMILLDRRLHQESRCAGAVPKHGAFEAPVHVITHIVALPIVLKPSATAASRNDPVARKEAALNGAINRTALTNSTRPAVTANTPRRHPAPMNSVGAAKPNAIAVAVLDRVAPRSRAAERVPFPRDFRGHWPRAATLSETLQHRECVEGLDRAPMEEPKAVSVIPSAPVEASTARKTRRTRALASTYRGTARCVVRVGSCCVWAIRCHQKRNRDEYGLFFLRQFGVG